MATTYWSQADGTTVIKQTKKNIPKAQNQDFNPNDPANLGKYLNPTWSLTEQSAWPWWQQTWASSDKKKQLLVNKWENKYKYLASDWQWYDWTLWDNRNIEKEIADKAKNNNSTWDTVKNTAIDFWKKVASSIPWADIITAPKTVYNNIENIVNRATAPSTNKTYTEGKDYSVTKQTKRNIPKSKKDTTDLEQYLNPTAKLWKNEYVNKWPTNDNLISGISLSTSQTWGASWSWANVPKATYDPNQQWTAPDVWTKKTTKIVSDINSPDLFNLDEDSLTQSKQAIAKKSKEDQLKTLESQKKWWMDVLTKNKTNLDNFYTQYDKELRDDQAKYEKEQEDLFKWYEWTRLRNAQWMARTLLARTWMNTKQLTPEALLQLSDEIGSKSLNDIYEAKTKKVDNIQKKKDAMTNLLNVMKEKKVISENQYNADYQSIQDKANSAIDQINNAYINTVFGIVDTSSLSKKQNKSSVMNAITNFGNAIWLSGTELKVLQSYIDKWYNTPEDAISAMIRDSWNQDSPLYKAMIDIKERQKAAAQQEYDLKLATKLKSQQPNDQLKLLAAQYLATRSDNPINKNPVDITWDDIASLNTDKNFQEAVSKSNLSPYMYSGQ